MLVPKTSNSLVSQSDGLPDIAVDQSGVSVPVVRVETEGGAQHTFSHAHPHYCIPRAEVSGATRRRNSVFNRNSNFSVKIKIMLGHSGVKSCLECSGRASLAQSDLNIPNSQ